MLVAPRGSESSVPAQVRSTNGRNSRLPLLRGQRGLAAAASAQWQRTSTPCPPWVHDGYFAPAPRYGAQVALARTLR